MILCFDVGYCATGWCMFDGRVAQAVAPDDVPSDSGDVPYLVALNAGVVVPTDGLSPKAMRAKRACDLHGERFERLLDGIRNVIDFVGEQPRKESYVVEDGPPPWIIVAEVPTMGAKGAAANRGMALALGAYRGAVAFSEIARAARRLDFVRTDVLAACFGKLRPTGDVKDVVRKFVQRRIVLPLGLVAQHLHEHVWDAAAVLFAMNGSQELRAQKWSDEALRQLAPATNDEARACACPVKKKAKGAVAA